MTRSIYLATPGGAEGRGGIGRMVRYLVEAWDEERFGPLRLVDSYGPGLKALMPLFFVKACFQLAGACALKRVTLLHVNMAERGSVWRKGAMVWIARAFGVPAIVHCHGADFVEYCRSLSPRRRRLLQATLASAERVVVLGGYWRRFALEELGLPPGSVEVLPNAVPAPTIANGAAPGAGGGAARLLFLGRLSDRKGLPELLQALASTELSKQGWSAVLAGDGEVGRFRAEVVALGLEGRVRIAGWVGPNEAERLLASSDVLVLPSRNEGLPIAILEAMAHGLAVVATPVGSIPDAVVDGESGLLVPPGDAERLATALAGLIAAPTARRRLGEAARRRFEERFSLPVYVERLARIYQAAATGGDGRGQAAGGAPGQAQHQSAGAG